MTVKDGEKYVSRQKRKTRNKSIYTQNFWYKKGCISKHLIKERLFKSTGDFPCGTVDKNLPANAGDTGSISCPGRFHMPRATKPVPHSCWGHAPEPTSPEYWAHVLQQCSPRLPQLEKAHGQQQRPSAAENKNK